MPGLNVDGGDHPVPGGLAGDPEHPVVAFFDVLPGHQGQHVRRGSGARRERLAVQRAQRVGDQLIDQGLAGGRVVRVTRWLARSGLVMVAVQHPPEPPRTGPPAGSSAARTLRTAARNWVTCSGCHGVVDRGGIQNPGPAFIAPAAAATTSAS